MCIQDTMLEHILTLKKFIFRFSLTTWNNNKTNRFVFMLPPFFKKNQVPDYQ
jgi:hypothetical protein